MAETRRSYRTSGTPSQESDSPPARSARPAPQKKGDSEFVTITSLFRSKSGKADTVFITPEILDKLAELREGDTLGVSANKSERLVLWFVRNKE